MDENRISLAEAIGILKQQREEHEESMARAREEEARRNHPLFGVRDWVKEELADYAHVAWSGWMRYLFQNGTRNPDGSFTIPADLVSRWERQIKTDYEKLPENEKDSDRAEAERMIAILEPWL